MSLVQNQRVTLADNKDLEAVPPSIGEQGYVAAVVDGRALIVFNDGTVAWFDAEDDTRLVATIPLVLDLSTWNADNLMLVDQFCAEAKIDRTQAVKELISAGLSHLGWKHP
jgi:hypothetical protein